MANRSGQFVVGILTRIVSFAVPYTLTGSRLLRSGFGVPVLIIALALTMSFYALMNCWYLRQIDNAYDSLVLAEFSAVSNNSQAADRAIKLRWADPRLRPWLEKVLGAPAPGFGAPRQLAIIFEAETPAVAPDRRLPLLRDLATGQCRPLFGALFLPNTENVLSQRPGLLSCCFHLRLSPSSGADALELIDGANGVSWLKVLDAKQDQLVEEKRRFVTRYLDALLIKMQEPIRAMQRINGGIQWLTIFLAFALMLVVGRRWLLIGKLAAAGRRLGAELDKNILTRRQTAPNASELAGLTDAYLGSRESAAVPAGAPKKAAVPPERKTETARREFDLIRDAADVGVHGVFGFFVAVLTSLGFLGTVMGLGDALLRADGLFSGQDRQRVVGLITQDLGFAFDTTLVALVAGMIVGVPLSFLRLQERRLLRDWERMLTNP